MMTGHQPTTTVENDGDEPTARSRTADGDRSPTPDARATPRTAKADASSDETAARSEFRSTVEHVPRLSGAVWIGLGLAAVGIATRTQVLVVGATIPLWYLAYGAATGMSEVSLRVARECPGLVTEPGERVSVALTVENVGDDPVSDLRIVDGVPDDLPVVDGSPRACVALGPGERATVEYEIESRRGTHRFEEPTVRARNLVGTVVETGSVAASGADELACELPVEQVPLGDRTTRRTGRVAADEGGSGVEFHAVRDYQRGDPVRKIDWRRYARTGDLTTVEHRAERSAVVGLVVDARPEMYVAAEEGATDGAAVAAYAADRTLDRLADAGYPTCLFPVTDGVARPIGPGKNTETIRRARGRLGELRTATPDRQQVVRDSWSTAPADLSKVVLDRLPGGATVLVFSPALDEFPAALCRILSRRGFDVTLVSPDLTDGEDPLLGVRRVQRRDRLLDLRGDGVGVVDWDRDRPLATALEAALAGGDER